MTDSRGLLSQCRIRVPRRPGLQRLHARELDASSDFSRGFRAEGGDAAVQGRLCSERLILRAGESFETRSDDLESVWVLQQGAARVDVGGGEHELSRASVFEERASAVYLPPRTNLAIHARRDLEMIVVATPCERRTRPLVVGPEDVRVATRGGAGYTREVHDLLVDDPCAQHLMVGETFNPPGGWSSFPPHKHDGDDGEPALEETYHFRVDPACGFGIQRLYTAHGEDVTFCVEDGDCVRIPYGYHPVAAAPGYRLYYLWALTGAERKLALHEDPRHAWVRASSASEPR